MRTRPGIDAREFGEILAAAERHDVPTESGPVLDHERHRPGPPSATQTVTGRPRKRPSARSRKRGSISLTAEPPSM